MKFIKMHGLGNDYVYLDGVSDPAIAALISRPDWASRVRRLSDRHRGVGGDGVIVLTAPSIPDAHVRMRMFNADGSEAQMCGNGLRCVAKLSRDRLGLVEALLCVQTGRGVLRVETEAGPDGLVQTATADMGPPILDPGSIPTTLGTDRAIDVALPGWAEVSRRLELSSGWSGRVSCVSMGNPHAVFFGPGVATLPLDRLGPLIESHPSFPERINVHVCEVHAADSASLRSWERGTGLTQACGTGACATLVAGVLTGRLAREATLRLPGGDLRLRWPSTEASVFKTGPAQVCFEGEWDPLR